jgi:hypothetical protein
LRRPGASGVSRRAQFPGETWSEIDALPEPVRLAVLNVIAHLLDEPVPSLAEPFPPDDPLPGAYELHLPSDDVTIWYTITPYHGEEVISIQAVRSI